MNSSARHQHPQGVPQTLSRSLFGLLAQHIGGFVAGGGSVS